jgi:hypothetical protein
LNGIVDRANNRIQLSKIKDDLTYAYAEGKITEQHYNTALARQRQADASCAVAVTCPEGTTTVTVTPPTTGTLSITKVCIGSVCPGAKFDIAVSGNNPQPHFFSLQNGQTQDVTLGPGSFTVTEGITPLRTTFTGDCSEDGTGTISAGQTLHCTITNTQTT